MHADLVALLNRESARIAPVGEILAVLRRWLADENPSCLLHPHGFFVVPIQRTDIEEWRFHFWPRGTRVIRGLPSQIHTHDKHVDSRILSGELTNVIYDVTQGDNQIHPLYEVSYEGDRYKSETSNCLRLTSKRVNPTERERQAMQSGDSYHIDRHVFHEAIVPDDISTSTLVCMYGYAPGPILVIGVDDHPETISFQRSEYRASHFSQHI